MTFDGNPWPAGASSDAISAVTTSTKAGRFAQAIATVQECATDPIYLVGHASGCAIANAVDRGLKDTSKVINGGSDRERLADIPEMTPDLA